MAKKKCITGTNIDEAIFDSSCSETEDVIQEPKGQDISRERSESEEEEEEILDVIGLPLICGVNRQNKHSVRELYSAENFPMYRGTLSEHRFRLLLKCLRFDISVTREDWKKRDKFAPLRDIWNMVMRKFPMFYNPNESATVDEELKTFHGRCPFRLYIPTKPGKYGIEVNLLCDSNTNYCLAADPYAG
ncbi:hypothetical protein ANN_08755 [Periplaneta americana]|uniref:PiggyBac transposable element-derived protein domain-containing protein n=1 Tax=Periplaneta americana TaxID=6978 RepID=A0ABQ8T2C4_PERAM|nr:hypothetical protein ANN_08755 [Periplaneta americana]